MQFSKPTQLSEVPSSLTTALDQLIPSKTISAFGRTLIMKQYTYSLVDGTLYVNVNLPEPELTDYLKAEIQEVLRQV